MDDRRVVDRARSLTDRRRNERNYRYDAGPDRPQSHRNPLASTPCKKSQCISRDREQLRICKRCDEIAYPAETEPRAYGSYGYLNPPPAHPSHCHFCGGSQLDAWDEAYLPLLEHGTAWHTDVDLTSARIDGLMNDHGDRKGSDL